MATAEKSTIREEDSADEATPLSSRDHEGGSKRGGQFHAKFSDENDTTLMKLYFLLGATEVVGITAVMLVVIWMSHYRGGFAWDGSSKEFNYHPIFMVVGMVFLYGNAALVYRVMRKTAKFYTKLIHMCIQVLVMIFIIIGLVTVFDFHNAQGIPNMYSLHSWIGLSTVLLFFLQFLFGFLAFLLPKFSDEYRAIYLLVHQYFGSAIFILAIGSCLLGTTEKLLFSISSTYSKFVSEGVLANTLGLVLILFGGLVVLILTKQEFRRQPDDSSYSPIQ